jgi:hypothetical protein
MAVSPPVLTGMVAKQRSLLVKIKPNESISLAEAKESISYDPASGVFTWLKNRSGRTPIGSIAGTKKPDGYTHIKLCGFTYQAHRLAWVLMTGEWPTGQIDHIDGDPSNTRWLNLRAANPQQNSANRKIRIDSTSGVKGVYWVEQNKRWRAQICFNRKKRHLGYFQKIEDAAAAYDIAASTFFGEFHRKEANGAR